MPSLRFIHASDIHLGAPVRGFARTDGTWAERLQQAIPQSFRRVIDTALTHDIDFVILAGDIFDTARPSYADFLLFFEGLERLDKAGIPTYVITGNHDPFTLWEPHAERLPESVHLIGAHQAEFALFERGNKPVCCIGARGYYNQAWAYNEDISAGISRKEAIQALGSRAEKAPFTIGIIHTGLNVDSKKAPCDPQELFDRGLDYWACGHLHLRTVYPAEDNPRVVFPGCIQGRDCRETGQRGCYIVNLSLPASARRSAGSKARAKKSSASASVQNSKNQPASRVKLEFVPTSSVIFQKLTIDVGACQTLADVSSLIQSEFFRAIGKTHCDYMVAHIVVTGTTALHSFLCQSKVRCDLRDLVNNAYTNFFCDSLSDATQAPSSKKQHTGAFASLVKEVTSHELSDSDAALNYVQSELVKRGIAVPRSLKTSIEHTNIAAEALVNDLLQKDRP